MYIFIIKGFRTIVFIFIVISTSFRPIYPPAFFRCLSNQGTFTELRTTSFIESTGVVCSDSDSHVFESTWTWGKWKHAIKRKNFTPSPCSKVCELHFRPEDMAIGIRTDDPRGFNKGRSSKFPEGSRVRQIPEEGRRTYRPKRCGNNNKDEDNSPKTLNDKNQQASSQKFRQLDVNCL